MIKVLTVYATLQVMWGECLSGALYEEDFRRIMAECGFPTFSVMQRSRIMVNNPEIEVFQVDRVARLFDIDFP